MKRKISVFISVILVIATLFSTAMPVAQAANSYSINGVSVKYSQFKTSPDECWVYANNFYNKIWGHNFNNKFNDKENSLRGLSDEELTLTAEHLKEYVSNAELGSVLRICNSKYLHGTDGWGHSQIIVSKDDKGFTVFEGGLSSSPYCREKYYTWNDYIKTSWLGGTYDYIKYIKWPNAPEYSPSGLTYSPCYLNLSMNINGNLYKEPYNLEENRISGVKLPKNSVFVATALVQNKYDNFWYKITADGHEGYIFAGNATVVDFLYSDLDISKTKSPYEIKKGDSFSIKGELVTEYNDIYTVTGAIYSGNTEKYGKTVYTKTNSYSLRGGAIDNALLFNKLGIGTYTYTLDARILNFYSPDGKTREFDDYTTRLIERTFTVSKTGSESSSSSKACTTHTYDLYDAVDPTCTTTGKVSYKCTVCGDTYSTVLDKLGHSYDLFYEVEPNCSIEAQECYYCIACGDSYTITSPKLEHSWNSGVTSNGVTTYTCTNCSETKTTAAATSGGVTIELQINNPVITINGSSSLIDEYSTTPVIRNDLTMLPIRPIIEAMGGTVDWWDGLRMIVLTIGDKALYLQIDNIDMWDDTNTYPLETPPVIINDRTMLPIRAVVEYFGGTVSWNSAERIVTIEYNPESTSSIKAPAPTTNTPTDCAYITVSIDGNIELMAQPISITKGDTVHDILVKAHEQFYPNGSKGFSAGIDPSWNIYLMTKVWGIESSPYVIVNNYPIGADPDAPASADSYVVASGDNIIVSLSAANNSFPVISLAANIQGNNVTITASKWSISMTTFMYESTPAANFNVMDASGNILGRTNASGKLTIPLTDIVVLEGYAAIQIC